jgi:hypothetical protein
MIDAIRENYSAAVALRLVKDGRSIPLSKIGPDFVVFAEPCELKGGPAIVRMYVDGHSRDWNVTIEDAVPFEDRVGIRDAAAP